MPDSPSPVVHLRLATLIGPHVGAADRRLLGDGLRLLADSKRGKALLLAAAGAAIYFRMGEPREMRIGIRGDTAGLYFRDSRTIVVSRDTALDSAELCLTLAHELQHFADDITGRGSYSLRNEAHAYITEAEVARELGLASTSLALHGDGSILGVEEVMARVARTFVYGGLPTEPPLVRGPVGNPAACAPDADADLARARGSRLIATRFG